MTKHLGICTIVLALFTFASCEKSNAQITFNFANSTGNAQADDGFQMAADYISSQFDDNITFNIDRGFSNLGGGVLGQASSSATTYTYSDFRTAVAGDVISSDDGTFSSTLPGGSSFNVYINGVNQNGGAAFNDNDGGNNNTTVRLNHANAKALGLRSATDTGQDVAITFNSSFTWDFDPTDGISAGAIDFVGVTIHEIMHGMGFTSGIDVLDFNFNGGFNDNQFTFVNSLDFARHSADAIAAGADIDWTADNRAKFFSFDGGATPGSNLGGGVNHFSRGVNQGDGRQASHWRDGLGLGIMDPTSQPAGSVNVVTELDLRALDIIGWNRVQQIPEPTAMVVLAMFGGLAVTRRRRS